MLSTLKSTLYLVEVFTAVPASAKQVIITVSKDGIRDRNSKRFHGSVDSPSSFQSKF